MHRPDSSLPHIKSLKQTMRRLMLAQRFAAGQSDLNAAQRLRDCFLSSISLPGPAVVAGYCPRKGEIDPSPLVASLIEAGHSFCLPSIAHKEGPLIFRFWAPGNPLVPGPLGSIPEPPNKASSACPDLLLVPLLAFDRQGHRLGYGGGYYDRTLAQFRQQRKVLAVGLAYSAQNVPFVPASDKDARLDAIVTEKGVFWP